MPTIGDWTPRRLAVYLARSARTPSMITFGWEDAVANLSSMGPLRGSTGGGMGYALGMAGGVYTNAGYRVPVPTFLTDYSLQYRVTSTGTSPVLTAKLHVNGVALSDTTTQVNPSSTGAQGLEKAIRPHILLEAGDVLNLNINMAATGTFTINPMLGVVRAIQ